MSYIIRVAFDDRVRYLNHDECGWHTTRRSRARTFFTPEEARQVIRDLKYVKGNVAVVPFKESRVWRKVVGLKKRTEEHTSVRGCQFSWRAIPVTTLTLECGHEKVVRGENVPRYRTVCSVCETAVVGE